MRYGPFFFKFEDPYTGHGTQSDPEVEAAHDTESADAFEKYFFSPDAPLKAWHNRTGNRFVLKENVELMLLPEHVHRTRVRRSKEPVLSTEEPMLPSDLHDDDPWIRELRSSVRGYVTRDIDKLQ